MKTDREMIESLIKRRDEYMAQNRSFKRTQNKISSPVRLIPKIAVPSLAILAVIVCVLAFNGVFDRGRIDIDLIGAGSSNMPNTSIPATSPADEDTESDKQDAWESFVSDDFSPSGTKNPEDSDNAAQIVNEIRASDIVNSIQNNMHFVESGDKMVKINTLSTELLDYIVCNGRIYKYVDPEKEDYLSLGFDENTAVLVDSLPQAVILELPGETANEKYYDSIYAVKSMEDYAAAIYERKIGIRLYRAVRPAYFIIGDSVYLTDFSERGSHLYTCSDMLVEQNKEYAVYYASYSSNGEICSEEKGEPVYIVRNYADFLSDDYEAWICQKTISLPPEGYRLKLNAMGMIEDTVQNIEKYCRGLSNGIFDVDSYSILGWNEDNIVFKPNFKEFVYDGNIYRPVSVNLDPDTVLTVEMNVRVNEQNGVSTYCTVFRVKDNADMIAAFCNGILHYFVKEES